MIVVDTTVLVYALGTEHPAREPSRRLIDAIGRGEVGGTTTPEVIQEFAHVYSRRRPRAIAARHAGRYADLLAPLLPVGSDELESGLHLFERNEALGAFDAVLAATALAADAEALVSADRGFASVPRLTFVELGTPALDTLLSPG